MRLKAKTQLEYAQLTLLVMQTARRTVMDFTFGPLDGAELERSGMVVEGPDAAEMVALVKEAMPGIEVSHE